MRSGFVLVSAACVLGTAPTRAGEFRNPLVIEVRSPGGELTIRARRGTASVPGLGEVEEVYGYDVGRGSAFPRAPATIDLMPPVISVDRGSTLRILYRNELRAPSNLHTHGLLVSPQGTGFEGDRRYGDCVFVMASAPGGGHAHAAAGGSGDPCSLEPGAALVRLGTGDIRYSYVIAPDRPSGL